MATQTPVGASKPPSLNALRERAGKFALKWKNEKRERAEAQSFWNDFFDIFGLDRYSLARFEAAAKRASNLSGSGRQDLLWSGVMLAEHKSAAKSEDKAEKLLDDAEGQAFEYLRSIPPFDAPSVIVCTDFGHIRILDLTKGSQSFTFPLTDLPKEIERFGFMVGYSNAGLTPAHEEQANIKAARLMGRLYEELAASGYPEHEASIFLTRLLFLLFGDDTGMWMRNLFQELVKTRTSPDGSDVGSALGQLFQVLNEPEKTRSKLLDEAFDRFPYVNGGLFSDPIRMPSFNETMRDRLLECCYFDWSKISPAIFGSMFQAVKSKEARRVLGEHYTTEENILKIVNPLVMEGLWAEYEDRKNSPIRLENLRAKLGTLTFLDPACGCGNFLIITYRELRRFELHLLDRIDELTPGYFQLQTDVTAFLSVSMDNFYGIELEEYPARIAEVAMFLTDHQANMEMEAKFGVKPDRLPITTTAHITVGNALRLDWDREVLAAKRASYILGNPPFIGMALLNAEQKADKAFVFKNVSGIKRSGRLDYVACWYGKTVPYMEQGKGIRAAYVSTNSITQGEQARSLGPFLSHHDIVIDFGYETFIWTSEAPERASVHVVIIGFSKNGTVPVSRRAIYGSDGVRVATRETNIYLSEPRPEVEKHSEPLVKGIPKLTEGNRPQDGRGGLILNEEERDEVLQKEPKLAPYVRPLIDTKFFLQNRPRYCFWLVNADPAIIANSPILKSRLARVEKARLESDTKAAHAKAKTPSLFYSIRQPKHRWLAVPRHSSDDRILIPMTFYDPEDIAHDTILTIDNADSYLFGILQSEMFNAWVRTMSGRIKSDPRLSPDLSYNSFPFPTDPSQVGRDRVVKAAENVLAVRANFGGVALGDLYKHLVVPPALMKAHDDLNKAVDALFTRKSMTSDALRREVLFMRYESLTNSQPSIPGTV